MWFIEMDNPRSTPDKRKHTTDKTGAIRFDFLFSYWIIIWFLVFYFIPEHAPGPISVWIREHMNPSLALRFALVENIAVLFWLMVHTLDGWTFTKYIAMMATIKVLPMYLLRKHPIRWEHDTLVFVIMFALYNVYLWWNDTNIYGVYERTFVSIREGKNQTPLFSLWNKWFGV